MIILVSKKAIRQYEAIRRLGQANMLNKSLVQRIAYENGFHELVAVIENGEYTKILKNYDEHIKVFIDEDKIPVAKRIEFEVKK